MASNSQVKQRITFELATKARAPSSRTQLRDRVLFIVDHLRNRISSITISSRACMLDPVSAFERRSMSVVAGLKSASSRTHAKVIQLATSKAEKRADEQAT